MWCRRAASVNELGAKLIRECYVSPCPCRRPSLVRTHGSWPCRPLSTAVEDTRNQPEPGTDAAAASRSAGAAAAPLKLHLLGDASSFANTARPMLGAPIRDSAVMEAKPAKEPKLEPMTFKEYTVEILQPFVEHDVAEVALSMSGQTLDGVLNVLEDLVVNCLASTKTLPKQSTDPEAQRSDLKLNFEKKMSGLMDVAGFSNLLNIIVYESATASNHQLIRAMAALSNFTDEGSVVAMKPIVERLARPLKPVMGRLSPGELNAFFHTYAVFQVSDAAVWKEALNQITNRFNLFEVSDLTQLLVSLTKAPYMAESVAYFLTKLSVRIHPLLGTMDSRSLINTLKAYKVTTLSERKTSGGGKFRQHALTELLARFSDLTDPLVYEVIAIMLESPERSSGLAACLDTYLRENYKAWSQPSLLMFLKYLYSADVTPSAIAIDFLSIKIFDLAKTGSPRAYMEAACFLADHGTLSQTLAMVICKELSDHPARLQMVSLSQLSKVVSVVKHIQHNPLPHQLPLHLATCFPSLSYDEQLHAVQALGNLELYSAKFIETLDTTLCSELARIPLDLKTAVFVYLRDAQLNGTRNVDELVDKVAGDLATMSLPWESSMKVLRGFQNASTSTELTATLQQLRYVAGQSSLDHFMSAKDFGVKAIDHLSMAIVAMSHQKERNESESALYGSLLKCVNMLSMISVESQAATKGRAMYGLVNAVYNLAGVEAKDGSLELESVMAILNLPLAHRVTWLGDTNKDQFFDILSIASACLKDHPVDLKSWLSSLQVHATKLVPSMSSQDATRMLGAFSGLGSIHVQLLRAFANRFRFLLFVFSSPELLTIAESFSRAGYNPEQFIGLCFEHMLVQLGRLSADEIFRAVEVAANVGDDGYLLLQSCPDLIRRTSSKYSPEQIMLFARRYTAAGYPSPILIDMALTASLAVMRSGAPLDRVKACSTAYFSTMLMCPLLPEFRAAMLTCLHDEEVKAASAASAPAHHHYAAATLALCHGGHLDADAMAHVFDAKTMTELFVVEDGTSRTVPGAVLDTFRDLYDVVLTHPHCTVTVDEELAERCGFADRSMREQDLLATGILEEDSFTPDVHGAVWPIGLVQTLERRRTSLLLPENIYRRLLPTSFGIIHALVARDAEGTLVELPELDPELSVPKWRQQLQDNCPALADPKATVYALFCPSPVAIQGSALGRLEMWLSLLELNNIRPLAFTPASFNQCIPENKDKFGGGFLDKTFSASDMPLCHPRKAVTPAAPNVDPTDATGIATPGADSTDSQRT